MAITTLPTKTDGDIGRAKSDVSRPDSLARTVDLDTDVPASEWEVIKSRIIEVFTEVGVSLFNIAAVGRVTLNQRVASLEALPIVTESGGSRELSNDDNGCVILCTAGGGCEVSIPDALGVGFNCLLVQKDASPITFAPDGVTIHYPPNVTESAGLNSIVSVIKYAAGHVLVGGALAP
jgi:hypothetical protein